MGASNSQLEKKPRTQSTFKPVDYSSSKGEVNFQPVCFPSSSKPYSEEENLTVQTYQDYNVVKHCQDDEDFKDLETCISKNELPPDLLDELLDELSDDDTDFNSFKEKRDGEAGDPLGASDPLRCAREVMDDIDGDDEEVEKPLSRAELLCEKSEEVRMMLETWKRVQMDLRSQLVTQEDFNFEDIRYIGGVDLSFTDNKNDFVHACACLVITTYPELEVVYEDCQIVHLTSVYIPEYLAFRETPSLVALFDKLREERADLLPQVVLVDGNGVLHPRGFGIASHLGVLIDIPTVGIAKKLFHIDGLEKNADHQQMIRSVLQEAGDTFPLEGNSGETHGMALRSTPSSPNPVYVSIGHKISLDMAVTISYACCQFRIPEPVRQADIRSREFLRKNYDKHNMDCTGYEELNKHFQELAAIR